jgi:intein/homing endonuclease
MTWDYIAGFFDGEGSITIKEHRVRIALPQTSFGVLHDIKKIAGVGSIFKVTKRKSHWKDSWVYYIAKQKDILYFLKKIERKLILKQSLAKIAIIKLQDRLYVRKRQRQKFLQNIQKSKKLRAKGLTYRQIGKLLSIDWGYVRRMVKFY